MVLELLQLLPTFENSEETYVYPRAVGFWGEALTGA